MKKHIVIKKGYYSDLIKRLTKSHDNNLNKPKIYGSEKFTSLLKLPHTKETPRVFESRIEKITKLLYNIVY